MPSFVFFNTLLLHKTNSRSSTPFFKLPVSS
uniref:Uncharacterized protein n=1 Tax=Rhizophora mucronata TaxID=61149 RepID=A0A2P2R2G7_RHIMU